MFSLDTRRHWIRLRDSCTWLRLRAAMVDRAFSVTADASLALAPRPDRRFLSAAWGASRVTVGTLCPTVRSWPGGAVRAAQGLSHRVRRRFLVTSRSLRMNDSREPSR